MSARESGQPPYPYGVVVDLGQQVAAMRAERDAAVARVRTLEGALTAIDYDLQAHPFDFNALARIRHELDAVGFTPPPRAAACPACAGTGHSGQLEDELCAACAGGGRADGR